MLEPEEEELPNLQHQGSEPQQQDQTVEIIIIIYVHRFSSLSLFMLFSSLSSSLPEEQKAHLI